MSCTMVLRFRFLKTFNNMKLFCFLFFTILVGTHTLSGQDQIKPNIVADSMPRMTVLAPVVVKAKKLKEEKFGIKNDFALMHFIDASINQKETFEIAQLIKFDTIPSKITSVNLLINEKRQDSSLFKINFYSVEDNKPLKRIIEKEIVQKQAIEKGWLTFDLNEYNIYMKDNFVVGIEFLSPLTDGQKPIAYEIKLGGTSKSFVRNNGEKEWKVPPHHFKLHITALVNSKRHKNNFEDEDRESVPALNLFSKSINDNFSIFIQTPSNYVKNPSKKYPVTYLLDANAYFDILANQKRILKDEILVGIGYENAYLMDSLRHRDYTYPVAVEQDSFAISGGGEKFLSFITKELVPYIDENYRTEPAKRALMGHSLGGYFSLFAFQKLSTTQADYFSKFVSASPTLYYGNEFLINDLRDNPISFDKKTDLVITYGENEFKSDSTLNNSFGSYLKELNLIENLRLKTKIFKRYGHMDTAVPTFENSL